MAVAKDSKQTDQAPANAAAADPGNLMHAFIESQFANSRLLQLLGRSGVERFAQLWANVTDEPLPENVVYVRVRQKLINQYVARPVSRTGAVTDTVLGASVTGSSTTSGGTQLVLVPDEHCARGEIRLNTDVAINTVASQSPVHIHSRGVTHV